MPQLARGPIEITLVGDFEVDEAISAVAETRQDVHPHVFTKVVIEHQVDGRVEAEALRRSIELSATRYCPLIAMLSATVTIEHRYRLREDGADAERTALVLVTGPAAA